MTLLAQQAPDVAAQRRYRRAGLRVRGRSEIDRVLMAESSFGAANRRIGWKADYPLLAAEDEKPDMRLKLGFGR
jgi:hypothetical protein